MPAKPAWYRRLPSIVEQLRSHPHPWVDRATIERLLGVGRRRAQQILAPCVSHRVGTNGLADRDALIRRLERLADGDQACYEIRQRQRVAHLIERLREERLRQPQVLVEAPVAVVNQQIESLPVGVKIAAGCITVEFESAQQALEKLLALAMAIGNDADAFERIANASD